MPINNIPTPAILCKIIKKKLRNKLNSLRTFVWISTTFK